MPSELNLTESWPFQSFFIIRHKKLRYPFVDYPTRGILLAVLDGAGERNTPGAAHEPQPA
jgi:hypothetical protein